MKRTRPSWLHGSLTLLFGMFFLTACSEKIVNADPGIEQTSTTSNSNESMENQETKLLNVRTWPSTATQPNFPEDNLNLKKTGICMSGGGTRAMVCAVGQLKALSELGLMDDIGYISCVSGGSWASVPFTYYTKGAANDQELLGTIIPPNQLTLHGMKTLTPGFLAGSANNRFLGNLIRDIGDTPPDEIWIKCVGDSYMKQYGLYGANTPKYFSYDWATVRDICARNPSLQASDFAVVRSGKNDIHRPYLVVNGSVSGMLKNAPFDNPEPLSVFNYTPLGIGAFVPLRPTFRSTTGEVHTGAIGGGFIEPFAFGAVAPQTAPTACVPNNAMINCLSLRMPEKSFTIIDATGTSSSAYMATFTSWKHLGYDLKDLSQQENYWQIPKIGEPLPEGETYMFGDGGNLENLGAITLLQRNVNKLIVFVNTDTKLNEKYDLTTYPIPTAKDVSLDILTLFGVDSEGLGDMYQNQVFAESDFRGVMKQFVEAKKNGHSIIAQSSHTTLQNDWWGIPAGRKVDVIWVYNDNVEDYLKQLEWEIRDQITLMNGRPDFHDFPNYKTVDEVFGKLVELTPQQINLLYQFSAWNVYSNPDRFKNFLLNE